jgi:outer membrane protein assembly factor BamB
MMFRQTVALLLLAARTGPACGQIVLWEQRFGSTDENVRSLVLASDGGYLLAGTSYRLPFDTLWDAYLVRTNEVGQLQWHRQVDFSRADQITSALALADGGFLITGATGGEALCGFGCGRESRIFLARTDETGAFLWTRTFDSGKEGGDIAYRVIQSREGDFVLAGSTSGFGEDNLWHVDAAVLRVDQEGDIVWQRSQGKVGRETIALDVAETASGDLIVAGYHSPSSNRSRAYLFRLNRDGSLIWEQGDALSGNRVHSLIEADDGGVIFAGGTSRDELPQVYLGKVDRGGNLLWEQSFESLEPGGRGGGRVVRKTRDTGFLLLATESQPFQRARAFLHRLDAKGERRWFYQLPAPRVGTDFLETDAGEFVVAGDSLDGVFLTKLAFREFQRGDATGDGNINITDAVAILLRLFGGAADFPCADAADADDNGAITLTDAVFVLSYLFKQGPVPPEPGPSGCGIDPTGDDLGCDRPRECS